MSMKGRLLLVISALFVMTASSAMALDKVDVSFSADYFSKYIWRGQNLFDDSVFQPSVGIAKDNLSFNIWGSMPLKNDSSGDNGGEFTEVDYTLDYSDSVPGVEGVGYSIGSILYDFPNTMFASTFEVYAGLNFDVILNPSITVYRDVKSDGTYVSGGIAYTIENILEGVNADLGATLGWGSSQYNKSYWTNTTTSMAVDKNAFNNLDLTAGFPFEVAGFSVTPSVAYVTLISSDIKDASSDNNYFFAGVDVAKSF